MPGLATKQNVSNSLKTNRELRWYVPDTRLSNRSTLKRMLDRYKMLYVKPNNGTGGKGVMPIEVLLKKHVPNIRDYKRRLESLGKRAAQRLNKTFPKIKELGLHIGIDENAHPWILEANPQPAIYGSRP
jgi:hypothetical protein